MSPRRVHWAQLAVAVVLVGAVYGYVIAMNPEFPIVTDESWRPWLEVLSFPGLCITTLLVVLGVMNVHGRALEVTYWLSSFVVYVGLFYLVLRLVTKLGGAKQPDR